MTKHLLRITVMVTHRNFEFNEDNFEAQEFDNRYEYKLIDHPDSFVETVYKSTMERPFLDLDNSTRSHMGHIWTLQSVEHPKKGRDEAVNVLLSAIKKQMETQHRQIVDSLDQFNKLLETFQIQ